MQQIVSGQFEHVASFSEQRFSYRFAFLKYEKSHRLLLDQVRALVAPCLIFFQVMRFDMDQLPHSVLPPALCGAFSGVLLATEVHPSPADRADAECGRTVEVFREARPKPG
jgi:hypothetical protein